MNSATTSQEEVTGWSRPCRIYPGPSVPPMIGTFGAVIRMKSPILTRKALVDIGASGPLIGFMAAIIVTCIGLSGVSVLPVSSAPDSLELGTPLVFKALSYIVLGPVPDGYDISLNAVTFAGWIGFFVTSINLLPIGQLDGGHISYALTGRRHRAFSFVAVAILVALGIYGWLGWLVWGRLSWRSASLIRRSKTPPNRLAGPGRS